MILESTRGRDLVRYLAKPIVAQIAPEELEDFDDLADDFFADPRLEEDKTLGAGVDLIPDLVIVLMFVATTLDRLLTKNIARTAKPLGERLVTALLRKSPDGEPPAATLFLSEEVQRAIAEATAAISHLEHDPHWTLERVQELQRLLSEAIPTDSHHEKAGGTRMGLLFLGANPDASMPLRVDRELRQVTAAIREAPLRNRISFNSDLAVTVDDLQRALLAHRPQVIHFAGHGNPSNAILLDDENGSAREISAASLSRLFGIFGSQIRCVVLNACFSEVQAMAIAGYVDAVIGMSAAVHDDAATSFSRAFYRALAYGQSVQKAFELGCSQIDLDGFSQQADIPRLIALRTDPRDLILISEAGPLH